MELSTEELSRRITELNGRINRLELLFEHNRKLNNNIVSALQTGDYSYLALEMMKEELNGKDIPNRL